MTNTSYKILKGVNYPPNKRAEIGAIVSDLPKESIPWLLASGVITEEKKPQDAFATKQKAKTFFKDKIGEESGI